MTDQEMVAAVNKLRKVGTNAKEACDKIGISGWKYFKLNKVPSAIKGHSRQKRSVQNITESLPMNAPTGKVWALYGTPSDLQQAMQVMQ